MKMLYVVVAVAIAGVVAVFVLFRPAAEIRNFPSAGTDIIAFGDSLLEGTGTTSGNDLVSQLSRKIDRPIVNLGRYGLTTKAGLVRIKEIDQYNPKVVLLLLGGNDFLRHVPREETAENLGKIIKDIQTRGAIVVLLGVRGGIFIDGFEGMYEDLRDEYQTAYVSDVLEGLFGNKEYMYDEIHPNDKGYAYIAERVALVLEPLLK